MEKCNRKIIIVTRKTRLENLIVRYNTIEQAQFVIEHSGDDFSYYLNEDAIYKKAVNEAISILESIGRVQILDREYISNFIFGRDDIVIAIGQDGLVANTLKYLDNQPLIGVNPDPSSYDGVLLPFKVEDLKAIINDVLNNKINTKEITMAQVSLNDGQSLVAVNDLFIGQKTHVSARYVLEYGSNKEQQSSSGIIISTGLGSTGWFKSILQGASKIAGAYSGRNMDFSQSGQFKWNSDFLYYTVREPYPSNSTKADMVFGKINKNSSFKIRSMMPENGVIFSDGIESDYLEFNSGSEASVYVSDNKGILVV
ncbi:sugar kinase [uncultured Clostridium sp.]|uniref:sugar kinase n=1 Tax=uncultured Clostridium sp. TaxID=59620 RepID=UPI0025DA7FD8|nr:sugar kinase [uncultured Clostridium sp.]